MTYTYVTIMEKNYYAVYQKRKLVFILSELVLLLVVQFKVKN